MFPGCNPARPLSVLSIRAVAARIKRHLTAKLVALESAVTGFGISDSATLSKQVGHSSVHVISKHYHAKEGSLAQ